MKKLIFKMLTIICLICPLTSCNSHDNIHKLEVVDNWELLMHPLEDEYEEGTIVEVHLAFRSGPSVGIILDDEIIVAQGEDTSRTCETYCNVVRFVMPNKDTTIYTHQNGEIGNPRFTLKNVLNIPDININEINKVKLVNGHIGVAPGRMDEIKYSSNEEDISKVFKLLDSKVVLETGDNWKIDGGNFVKYSLITSDNKYDIRIANGYISVNEKHYKYLGDYIDFIYPDLKANSFVTYIDTFEAYRSDGSRIGEFEGLSEYEFIKYPYDVITENMPKGYLETEFGRINVHQENIFFFEESNMDTYYLLVGEKNFSFF